MLEKLNQNITQKLEELGLGASPYQHSNPADRSPTQESGRAEQPPEAHRGRPCSRRAPRAGGPGSGQRRALLFGNLQRPRACFRDREEAGPTWGGTRQSWMEASVPLELTMSKVSKVRFLGCHPKMNGIG